jgi:hypothetical protein
MKGLVGLFPSPEVYVERLETFFNKSEGWFLGNAIPDPYYWSGELVVHGHVRSKCPRPLCEDSHVDVAVPLRILGNEPDILAPWQFAAAGNQYASRTQVQLMD